MQSVAELEEQLLEMLESKSAQNSVLQRELVAKWYSFSTLYYFGSDSNLLTQRKVDMAKFYILHPDAPLSLEQDLLKLSMQIQTPAGTPCDQMRFFLGGFCAQTISWSKIMRYLCVWDVSSASAQILSQMRTTGALSSSQSNQMLNQVNSMLENGGRIVAQRDALMSCRQVLAPVIVQHDFQPLKFSDSYSSPSIELIAPLKYIQFQARAKKSMLR